MCHLCSLRLSRTSSFLMENECSRVMPSLFQQLPFTEDLPGYGWWCGLASLSLYINHFHQEVLNAVIHLCIQQMHLTLISF